MYKFIRCNTDVRLPGVEGWYLEVLAGDLATIMDLHLGIIASYYARFVQDPHLDPQGPYNPRNLAAKWLESLHKFLNADGRVLVNSCGGMLPPDGIAFRGVIDSDKMIWPDTYKDERITISKWPGGKHYYLSSTHSRIFVPDKYSTYKAAREMALEYVAEDRIISR